MAKQAKKKRPKQASPQGGQSARPSVRRQVLTVIVSLLLVISLGLPAASLSLMSCSSCSPFRIELYD